MTTEHFEAWKQENTTETVKETINRIEYYFCTLKDGWIGVFQKENSGELAPIIKSADLAHARTYCSMIEPVTVPFNII